MRSVSLYFISNDTASSEAYTHHLHDAIPILGERIVQRHLALIDELPDRHGGEYLGDGRDVERSDRREGIHRRGDRDRKSTRLNSSHITISYAVFCLKKKKESKAQASSAD